MAQAECSLDYQPCLDQPWAGPIRPRRRGPQDDGPTQHRSASTAVGFLGLQLRVQFHFWNSHSDMPCVTLLFHPCKPHHKLLALNSLHYKLISIITHFGPSGTAGHFIAFCFIKDKNKWYKFNDSNVTESNFQEASTSGDTYILFYERQ